MSRYGFPIIVHVVGNNNYCVVRAGEPPTGGCAELVVSSQVVVWWASCGTSDTVYPCVRVVFFSGFVGLFVFSVLSVINKERLLIAYWTSVRWA